MNVSERDDAHMDELQRVISEAVSAYQDRVAIAIETAMGQAALKNKGGVRVTRTMGNTTASYDPTAPYLTVVYEATTFGPEVET